MHRKFWMTVGICIDIVGKFGLKMANFGSKLSPKKSEEIWGISW
jgi:hypothetical protein|nr:MAG TPA: hypothetical protein [Caudoviricetes sp.]